MIFAANFTSDEGRRIAAEWLARRTLKSQVPGSIPGSGKAHVEWKGYSITKQKPSSARGSFVSFSANSKLAPILGHARRFIRRLRHILNIVHELIIRCEEGNKIILYYHKPSCFPLNYVPEAEDAVGPTTRGDRMGKPLSFATEDSSFCCGWKIEFVRGPVNSIDI